MTLTPDELARIRANNPIAARFDDATLTHYVEVLQTAGLWDKTQQQDHEADEILEAYELEREEPQ